MYPPDVLPTLYPIPQRNVNRLLRGGQNEPILYDFYLVFLVSRDDEGV